MQTVARADITFAEARFQHRLHGGNGREEVGAPKGQLERTVSAAGDARNYGGIAHVVGGAEVGNKVAGHEGFPANRSGRVLHVVIEAGSWRGNDHGGNGA